ncbi:MAG: secretin and TonB N-terminal domain-containing protein [Candidatus Omnitrophica bacterium]|nr:secretin and TonB N-terminal domain-containing protein [Candidatus Omnitrophota bacterium]
MKNLKGNYRIKMLSIGIVVYLSLFLFVPKIYSDDLPAWQNIIFEDETQKISMDFKEANLKDVLKIFSQQAELNFIASSAIEDRKITLYLNNVPVDEALDKLLRANNLGYERDSYSDIFIVRDKGESAIETETRVFYLKYARVPSSRLSREIESAASDTEDASGGTSASNEFNIVEAIRRLLSLHGNIVEDARTNSLIVTDIHSRFAVIENTIAKLDISIPQVAIEVEMLDINQNVLDELGVKFANADLLSFTGPSAETDFLFNKNRANAPTSQETHFGILSAERLILTLELLKTRTDTKFLARPRLLTLSNETSEIKITADEAIGVTTETAAAGGTTGSITETAERAETGISLRVTPQVNITSGEIIMLLETKVIEAKTGSITLGGNILKDPEVRGTKSIVMVNDGETVVIGGLIRTTDSQTKKRVPFLGDIPFLGALFRHREGDTKNRELIIFITPRVVKSGGVPLIQSAGRFINNEREQGPLGSSSDEVDKALTEFEERNDL